MFGIKTAEEQMLEQLDKSAELNSIVCVMPSTYILKERALNHMIKKGWICVQNDVACTECTVHYALTFATKEVADSFKV